MMCTSSWRPERLRSPTPRATCSLWFGNMSMDDDDTKAHNRLLAYTAVRFGGLLIFFLGIAITYTDLIREGGWPQIGAIVAIMGVIDAFFAPLLLKRAWDEQDAAAVDRPVDDRTDASDQ